MLYRLKEKCGNHRVGKVTHEPGSVIESDDDLYKLFPNKFELVTVPLIPNATQPEIPTPPTSLEEPEEQAPEEVSTTKTKTKTKKKTKKEAGDVELGKDVTSDFELAGEIGLKVFVKNKKYVVIDPDDDSVVNEQELKKSEVEAFLKTQAEDDEDEDDEE